MAIFSLAQTRKQLSSRDMRTTWTLCLLCFCYIIFVGPIVLCTLTGVRGQIKQVKAVDRRRNDQQRSVVDAVSQWLIAKQLELGVAGDYLARAAGDVTPEQVTGIQIGLGKGAAAGQVGPEVMCAPAQAMTPALAGGVEHLRVEQAVAGGCGGG